MNTLVDRREQRPVPVNTGEWHSVVVGENATKQTIGVRYYEPSELTRPDEILLDGIAWSVHASKERDVWRTGATAEATGMRVIGLEMPGMGPNSGPLTSKQAKDLFSADWTSIGEAQWEAIIEVLRAKGVDIEGKTLHFDGNSMSVSSNIGLIAAAPEGVKIGNVIAWEGIAWQPKSKLAAIANIGGIACRALSMGSKILKYQKLAGEIPESIEQTLDTEKRPKPEGSRFKRGVRKIGSWILPIVAMAHGNDAHQLINALSGRDTSDTVVHLWNGEKSLMSRTKANERGATLLRVAGITVQRETDADGRHLVEDNIPFSLERKLSVLGAKA